MSKNYHLKLKGYVGGWDFDRGYVDYILDKNKGSHVDVLIDSLGGSVAHALTISAAFKEHGDVSVHYVGMNASAATIASMGAKHISIDAGAMYLVHKASYEFFDWSQRNADQFAELIEECQKKKADLDKIDENIAALYGRRCKKPAADLMALMEVGGWLTAQEALDWGFVDEITDYDDEPAAELTAQMAAAMEAEGIPVPDMQISEPEVAATQNKSLLAKLMQQLTSLVKQQLKNFKNTMKKNYTLMCALLGVTAIELTDSNASMTEQQLDSIEEALADKDKTIAELTAKIDGHAAEMADKDKTIADLKEKLDAKPADETKQVVDDAAKGTEQEQDAYMQYCETFASAAKAINDLP